MFYRHLIVSVQCKPALILIGQRRTRQRQFWSGRIGYLKSRPQHSLFHVGRGVRTPCTNLHIWPVLQPTPIMRRKKTRSDTYLSGRWMDSSEVSDIIYWCSRWTAWRFLGQNHTWGRCIPSNIDISSGWFDKTNPRDNLHSFFVALSSKQEQGIVHIFPPTSCIMCRCLDIDDDLLTWNERNVVGEKICSGHWNYSYGWINTLGVSLWPLSPYIYLIDVQSPRTSVLSILFRISDKYNMR